MDVSADTGVLDLNEYENDTTVIDLNDGTRRVNAYGKPNSRLGESYDLIPELDASINDYGEMDVPVDTGVLDLNEYENDTTVIDLNDGTRRVNAYGKPNSRLGERYDLIPELDASINDHGLIRLALPCIRYIVNVKMYTVNGKQEVRILNIHDMDSCCTRTLNFKMSVKWADLTDGDRGTNRYAYHNIHRIPFNTSDGFQPADVLRVLRTDLSDCDRDGGRIACFKGGDYVRSVVIELDLFRLDLNCLKCSKWMDFEVTTVWIRGEFNK